MKAIYNILKKTLVLTALFIFTTNAMFAHFGSKGPLGGSVSCGTSDATTVYLGTNTGGVFFSTNSTLVAWSAKPVGLHSGKITALVHTGSYLFAATADSGVYIYTGYVGTDRYWKPINTGLTNLKITSLVAIDSITVLAGTDGGGVFKTSNKGVTWVASNNLLPHTDITAFTNAGTRIINTSDGGVWATDDNGASWIDFNDINTDDIDANVVSYNATTDQILIANTTGLFLSGSASTTTTPTYLLEQTGLPANIIIHSISNDGTTWYLGTDKGVFTSPTGAISWIAANTGLPTLDVTIVVPFQTNLVVGTNKEGIVKSTAASISWIANNAGFNNLETYSMYSDGLALVITATEKGVFVSTDLAANYKKANKGLTDSLNVTDLTFLGAKLYATTKNAGVFVSADTGKNWNTFNGGLSNINIKKVVASSSNIYVYDSNGDVYQSNGASFWMAIQTGLPVGVVPTSIAFFGANIFLGTYGTGIYIRDESGSSWAQSNTGLSNLNVTSVTANTTKIFVGTDGSGVFVSDPTTINWAITANTQTAIPHTTIMNLDGTKIEAMAYYAGYVFASYKGGLLATSDNGTTWITGGNQFNLPSYTHVYKISFVTTRVFVTTENNCLYSNALSELPAIVGISEKTMSSIAGNYSVSPNPSNGNFIIDLNNIKGDIKQITIYDNIGRIVKSFYNNALQQTISIDAPASGFYYIQVHTSKGTITQKVIIE